VYLQADVHSLHINGDNDTPGHDSSVLIHNNDVREDADQPVIKRKIVYQCHLRLFCHYCYMPKTVSQPKLLLFQHVTFVTEFLPLLADKDLRVNHIIFTI